MSIAYHYKTSEEKLELEYLEALINREIPPKYKFLGSKNAKSWIKSCTDSNYSLYLESFKFLNSIEADISAELPNEINIIAVCVANLLKDKVLIEEFMKNKDISFSLMDTSEELCSYIMQNLEDINIPKSVYISELNNRKNLKLVSKQTKKKNHESNLFTILGNTFGVYPNGMMLKTIKDAMTSDDYALIETHISPDATDPKYIQSMITNYGNEDYNNHIMQVFNKCDISEDDGYIDVTYSNDRLFPDIDKVSHYFTFKKNKTIRYLDEKLSFVKGEKILATYSNKYKLNILRKIIKTNGFKMVKEYINREKGLIYILCQIK
ncbi:MAG: Unknown protein [uncultured Campylobacterales bacterium]|uniref:Histidine-specific methyltransferase SAM-dependent domain-containing protein n=1 Tax=uncultured Campylobacterales bacterium TaxID=352960 RepID=A0A6S6SC35_9BACT|nr:MAG: Unknown protein [uncultured Campylobacterales bacterium]